MDMRCGIWNVRSLYRSGSLKTVARELGEYELDLVGVQEVRWNKGATERAEELVSFSRLLINNCLIFNNGSIFEIPFSAMKNILF
jgi:hypothetical protein